MPIIIIDNFQVDISNPIDNRFVVGSQSIPSGPNPVYPTPFYAYKQDIVYKYPGLRIWDFNDNVPYVWDGTQWINENTTGALVQNAATGNTGFENFVTKFANNTTLLTKSLLFDNTTHVGLGLTTPTPNNYSPSPISSSTPINGLHVSGNIKTNNYFIGNGQFINDIHAPNITTGYLSLARIFPPNPITPGLTYLLKNISGNTSWDLLTTIMPFTSAANSTLSPSLTNIYGNGGTVYQGISVDPLTGAGTLLFKPLVSTGLQITDNIDHIRIESKAGVNIGVGSASFYAGLNGNQLHQFKSIKSNNLAISESNDLVNIDVIIVSGSLNITASQSNGFPAIQIETPVDVNDKSFYVNQNYVGPEQGTIAKPYRSLRAAVQAFIGAGTKFIPEWRYRGKIVLLSSVYTPSNNTDPNYIDYLDVNFLVIEGGGFELNYSGGMSYFISTKNILYPVNSVFGLASTAIFPFSYGGNGQGPINPTTQRINNSDIALWFRNLSIVSNKHGIIYHLNYSSPIDPEYTQQNSSYISLKDCSIYDYAFLNQTSSYSPAYVNGTSGTQATNFGSPVYVQSGLPTNEYVIVAENRNWNGEGAFDFVDCTVIGSSTTAVYVYNTSCSWYNITISYQTEYTNYNNTVLIGSGPNRRYTPKTGIFYILSKYDKGAPTYKLKANYLRIEGFKEYSSSASANNYQIGGNEALFKLEHTPHVFTPGPDAGIYSYFEIKNGYVYGEVCNHLIMTDYKHTAQLNDCDFSRFASLDPTYGAFKLTSSTTGQRNIGLQGCYIKDVKNPGTNLLFIKPYTPFSIINNNLFTLTSGTY
jgi:hypothetical protein